MINANHGGAQLVAASCTHSTALQLAPQAAQSLAEKFEATIQPDKAIVSGKVKKIIKSQTGLLPSHPALSRLCQVFDYKWQSIHAPLPSGNASPAWQTQTAYPLEPRVLARDWQDPFSLVGVRFGNTTEYGMLDIDKHSQYLSVEAIAGIKAALEGIGLVRLVVVSSSYSSGIHLYIPLPERVNTVRLSQVLQGCLVSSGFEVKGGTLEIFPNVRSYNAEHNGHRLPLQHGSELLDDDLSPLPGSSSLARLERLWKGWDDAASSQDMDAFRKAMGEFGHVRGRAEIRVK